MSRSSFFLLFGMVFLFSSCTLKEPGSPKWQVELNIPIADRVYSLSEIIDDSTLADSSGEWISCSGDTLFLNFSDSLDRVEITDELQFDGMTDIVEAEVGVRRLNSPGSETTEFQMENINSLAGQTVTIPEFNFSIHPQELDEYDEYDWVYLDWGDATLTVTNYTQVPFDTLCITIYNVSPPYALLLSVTIEELIYPDSSWTQSYPLPIGVEIDNEVIVRISGHSPGEPELIEIHDNNHILVEVEISDLGVRSARAHIPAQTFTEDSIYSFESEDSVRRAIIDQGTLSYTIRNGTDVITGVTFRLPDFSVNGQPFEYNDTLLQNEVITVVGSSLSGFEYYRENMDNLVRGELLIDILDTDYLPYPNPGSFVIIHQDSTVTAEFEVSQLTFSHLEGYLENTVLEIDPESIVIEGIPGGLDSLNAEAANIQLQMTNVIGGAIDVDLTLDAYKDGNLATSFIVPTVQIPSGNLANPGLLDVTISGLEEIINVLPDSIIHKGEGRISGCVDLEKGQWIEGRYHIFSPFHLAIGGSSLEPEIQTIDDGFDNQLDHVNITLQLVNHVPFSGEALIRASYDSTEFDNPTSTEVDTFFQVPLPPPELDIEGYVAEPGMVEIECFLNSDQIEMFAEADENRPLYIETYVVINSTNGEIVKARSTDHITVGAWAHLILDVDFEGDDEE